MIKRVEINYRGVFQKTLARKIGGDIVMIASRMGRVGFSNGRYSDAPERNGIPSKYFTFISPDLQEEELEAECGAKLDIDVADVSIVLDDTLVKGAESWAWYGIHALNEKVQEGGTMVVVSHRSPENLLQFLAGKPYKWNLSVYDGDPSFSGMWVFKDDLTYERTLGAVAAADAGIISIEAVEAHLKAKYPKEALRAEAARKAYDEVLENRKVVSAGSGVEWNHKIPMLPKWHEFGDGAAIPAVKRGFALGPGGQSRNLQFQRGTTKTQRPVVRFDLCTKCSLCWLECPDESFDPTPDGLYDVNYPYCVGCGKCAEVCPVKECIVMMDELNFEDDASPWEAYRKDPAGYVSWAEEHKVGGRYTHPFITGRGFEVVQGESIPMGGKRAANKKAAKIDPGGKQ